jgi:hypothetical protein
VSSTRTGIEWTEATWNPVTGCDRVSEGCDHGWRIDEPGDLGAPESPVVLRRAVELLFQEGFTLEEIADDTALPLDQVQRILDAAAPTRQEVVV